MASDRAESVRRGLRLNYLSLAYNVFEAVVAIGSGVVAGSVALVGFGLDSAIELTSTAAAQWRLRADDHDTRRVRAEQQSVRIIGGAFLVLAVFVTVDSLSALVRRETPHTSVIGLSILALSVVVMPLFARAKRRIATALRSEALVADSIQMSLCAWLSAIALAGVALNAIAGWWWADPIAALVMVPIIAMEGVEGVRGEASHCDTCL